MQDLRLRRWCYAPNPGRYWLMKCCLVWQWLSLWLYADKSGDDCQFRLCGTGLFQIWAPSWPFLPNKTRNLEIGKASFSVRKDDVHFCMRSFGMERYSGRCILEEKGISVEVINMHTVKPLDERSVIESIRKTVGAVTAENIIFSEAWAMLLHNVRQRGFSHSDRICRHKRYIRAKVEHPGTCSRNMALINGYCDCSWKVMNEKK